ncbi:MAG: biotin-dependent carboxyltransferase family protein, partial [Actinocatenispora sp.]
DRDGDPDAHPDRDGDADPDGGRSGAADRSTAPDGPTLRVFPGPRVDWFTAAAVEAFLTEPYTVSPTSNRVGTRLTGTALTRAVTDELPSEGLVLGAVQVPANGEPLVFLADHPTTGGYPVIAVLDPADVPLIAQARPGTRVRFAPSGTTWREVTGGPQQ